MIGRIRGIIAVKQPPYMLLDVNGVGYEIEAPMTTFYALPEVGTEIQIYTHLIVREDAHLLYGFGSENERRLFRTLIKVNGVGAKMALTILSGMESNDFALCIQQGDTDRLTKLPGVGKKTAERLVVEMRDRLEDWNALPAAGDPVMMAQSKKEEPTEEAISALIALGYRPQEASRFVHGVATGEMSSEQIIRAALKASVKK